MAQTHYTAFTVQSGQVTGTLTDFPVGILLSSLARLESVAEGGHVAGAAGFDIRPYSDAGLTSALTYELVSYDDTTGELEMYVKIPSLTDSTVIYLGYGDSALNTDGSSNTTWKSAYKCVYHMGDGTTLSMADSTSNANTLTNTNSATEAAGGIAGSSVALASASSQYLLSTTIPVTTTPCTITHLAYCTNFAANTIGVSTAASGSTATNFMTSSRTTQIVRGFHNTAQVSTTDTHAATTWVHYGARFISGASRYAFLNGVASAENTTSVSDVTAGRFGVGANVANSSAAQFWNGRIDEVRIMDVDAGADWIAAEYNNLIGQASFFSVGAEQTVGGGGSGIAHLIGGKLVNNGILLKGLV